MNRTIATGLFSFLLALTLLATVAVAAVLLRLLPASSAPGDDAADVVFGQGGSFATNTCNLGGVSANGLCGAIGVVVDGADNVYVADFDNHRVLEYDSPLTTDAVADRVFGQPNFASSTCNTAGFGSPPSASSLCQPTGVAVDGAGNVYIVDFNNSRVLEFDSPLTTDTVADRVFGQPDFASRFCNQAAAPSAVSLCRPVGVEVDGAANLYVGDSDNQRVLEYDSPLTTDTIADRVFGQPDFSSNVCNQGAAFPSASTLCFPHGVAVGTSGNVYVGDAANDRVLEYDIPFTTDVVADLVLGQTNFTGFDCNQGGGLGSANASSLCGPHDTSVDAAGNLYVADGDNERVLEYQNPLTTDTVSDRVFGQAGSFTSGTCNLGGISANSLCDPWGVALDGAGNLYVADRNNNRVLQYDSPLAPTHTPTPCPPEGCPTPTPTPTATPTATPPGSCPTATATPTNTPTPGASTPTRTATPTSQDPVPITSVVCNDTGQTVSDLHVGVSPLFSNEVSCCVVQASPPGCGAAAHYYATEFPFNSHSQVDLVWQTLCVDPFETVSLTFQCNHDCMNQPSQVVCYNWTRSGTWLVSGDSCGTTAPQNAPYATFLNGSAQAADDLHFRVTNFGRPIQVLLDNAPGCAGPTVTPNGSDPVLVDVVWPAACVDPNESVSVTFFSSSCTVSRCRSPVVECFNYTLDGVFLGSPDPCPGPIPTATPTATATATPTVTATPVPGLHDGKAKRIAAAKFVVLSDGTADVKDITIEVRNEGDHTESFGVYLDVVAPGGSNGSNPNGCTPHGRIIDTAVSLAPGPQTGVTTTQTFDCANVAGALGQTYTLIGVVDVHADDGGACGPFQLQSMTCFNALADDDNDDTDNRVTINAFRVR
jgi:NHL repeat